MPKTIVMLCSLDTKPNETQFLQSCIEQLDMHTLLVNIGYGQPAVIPAYFNADTVARAADSDLASVFAMTDTNMASDVMMRGAIACVQQLITQDKCDAIIAFGGASNSSLASGVMQQLPVGLPKLIISSAAAIPAYSAKYFGSKDITILHSVVDLSGLNDISRAILRQGAGAICGMAESSPGFAASKTSAKLVAVTTFRFAETCSQKVMQKLQMAGYTPIPFHAQGLGENTMEDMIAQGLFTGVIDVVPAGLSEKLLGGNRAARADRLEAAGSASVPLVVATSGFDMISCGPIERKNAGDPLWEQRSLAKRQISIPDQFRVEARTTAEEVTEIAKLVAHKLNKSSSPATVIIPTKGWSTLSVAGADLYDPEADAGFAPALRESLNSNVKMVEIPSELNTDVYANALVEALLEMIN